MKPISKPGRTAGYKSAYPKDCPTSESRWKTLDGARSASLRRYEKYAMWSVPSVFPENLSDSENTDIPGPQDSVGAMGVNNLANKIVTALFPMHSPFMRVKVSDDELERIKEDAVNGDLSARTILDNVEKALALAEKRAIRELNYNRFRTEATNATKALIVTGNTMMYFPEDTKTTTQVYSIRDYVVVRDMSGTVIEFITRDSKAFSSLSPKVQEELESKDHKHRDKTKDEDVTIYTQVKLGTDGRYHLRQFADKVELDSSGHWTQHELPWIILTWNRNRGENYGRGLIEDMSGAFNGLYTLNIAFTSVVGACADIKWMVRPGSVVDVEELNNAESGTYHQGEEGDVTVLQVNKQVDLAVVQTKIDAWTQQIGKACLMFSAVQRDAERVTAEEIRQVILDLESQYAGIYSRFADEWQAPIAKLILKKVKINIGDGRQVYPEIITGLDSLSRAGDMDNLRVWMQDLSLWETLPDKMQAALSPSRYAAFCGVRRGVDYEMLLATQEEVQAEQQQMMDMQNQMAQQQQLGDVAAAAASEEIKG